MYIAVRITAENVDRIVEVENKHYSVWKTIGEEMRINQDELHTIAENKDMDDEERFYAVIDKAEPSPTLETLTMILQSPPVISAIEGI